MAPHYSNSWQLFHKKLVEYLSVCTLRMCETKVCGWRRVLELGNWLGYEWAGRPRNWGLFPRVAWGFVFLYDFRTCYEPQPVSCRMKSTGCTRGERVAGISLTPIQLYRHTCLAHILVLCVTNLMDNFTSTLCFFFLYFSLFRFPLPFLFCLHDSAH